MNVRSFLPRLRLSIVIIVMLALYVALIFNFYRLQVQKEAYYVERAQSQFAFSAALKAVRGTIYFSDKNQNKIPAATVKSYPVIFAVPREIEDIEETANMLHELIGLDVAVVKSALKNPKNLYARLIQKATDEQVAKVRDASLKGIYIVDSDFRFFPFQELGAHILGFVGLSDDGTEVGRYGIEKFYDKVLAGVPGAVHGDQIQEGVSGADVNLTIDRNIQSHAEEILSSLVEDHKAASGTVIVEEPKTGKILAMGSYPTFDPNDYSTYGMGRFLNPANAAIYEPGSVFKVLTMAGALDAGKIKPDTRYYDSGELILNGKTIRNWDLKAHGSVTMTEVIEQSINTGAAFAERQLGHDNFYNYLTKFGFGELTGIDLPAEVKGSLRTLKNNARDINYATASFGQGVSVTPIALINAVSAIANGGYLMRPYITGDTKPKIIRQVISKEAAEATTHMMVSAVDKALLAAIPKYEVAGKTGTAQVPDFKNGGYTHDVINTYIGYAPAFDPRFIVMIKLDKPFGAPLAGATVVPAFRELAQFILNYYNVPPDHE